MVRKAMVAIGVDKTASSFPTLRAAAFGAKQVADWANNQGFDCVLLTDEGSKKVSHKDVFDAVKKFAEAGIYDQLVLYFSGHGVLMGPDCEVWLLSDAPDNQNEAINVFGSIANARTCGIDHIVVYSDACRSFPANWRGVMLTPGTIFPVQNPKSPAPEVDVFYATLPGNPSFEVPPDQASRTYRGLFTDCLMKALRGQVSSVIVSDTQRQVVPARQLKIYLVGAVPQAATRVSIKLMQFPDARVETILPKYLAEVASVIGQNVKPQHIVDQDVVVNTFPSSGLRQTINKIQERVLVQGYFDRTPVVLSDIPDSNGVQSDMTSILEAKGREGFETRTGFSVHGVELKSAFITGTSCDIFIEDGATHIRIHEVYENSTYDRKYERRTASIRFSDGSGVVLSVLPGYVGTVVVVDGQVVTVNYTPSLHSSNYWDYERVSERLEQRRAFVAVAARNGVFRLDNAEYAADHLRVLKRIDPTLGIYAAYAYAQVGNFAGVRSIFHIMNDEPEPVPFDVAMLAFQLETREHVTLDFAPGMPMLTQGWMSLGRFEAIMPDSLKAARCYLKPSLWTTFAAEGMDILEKELKKGE
ncbi:caspase family protein [Undibacterium sp. Tian12W]|uniref:caspase family protein n=1 Tax=Undibacterium sp. Tian12W TaxID=3413054 RepID=UPI003BF11C11